MLSIISKFSVFLCFCLSLLLGLAVFGYFVKSLVIIILLGICAFAIWLIAKYWREVKKIDAFVIFTLLIFTIFIGAFQHDLARGRDDASYLAASIKIAETRSLIFEDKLTHAYTGFRNLSDDIFTSQFLPGYSTYLAAFYAVGGLPALFWSNALLIFLTLVTIYALTAALSNRKSAIITLLFLGTFFTTFWFPRRLVSENLFMFLFWSSVLFLFLAILKKQRAFFWYGFLPITLTLFVRGEAIGFWLVYLILAAAFSCQRKFFAAQANKKKASLFAVIALIAANLAIFCYYLIAHNGLAYHFSQFYSPFKFFAPLAIGAGLIFAGILITVVFLQKYARAAWQKLENFFVTHFQKIICLCVATTIIGFELFVLLSGRLNWNFYQIQYGFKALSLLLLVFYVLVILFGLWKQIFQREELFLTILCAPSFLFLLRSNIAADLPWFLRHFFPVFIPYVFLLTALCGWRGLDVKFGKNWLKFCAFLIAINLFLSLPIITFSEHRGIQPQLTDLAKTFNNKDLIVMTPGWDWQKWAYSLHYAYGTNILPNLNLYPEKKFKAEIDARKDEFADDVMVLKLKNEFDQKSFTEFQKLLANYEQIYVLSEKSDLVIYPYAKENLEYIKDIKFQYEFVESAVGVNKYVQQAGKNLDLKTLNIKAEEIPPQTRREEELILKLYRVKDKNLTIFPQREYDAENIEAFRKQLNRWFR